MKSPQAILALLLIVLIACLGAMLAMGPLDPEGDGDAGSPGTEAVDPLELEPEEVDPLQRAEVETEERPELATRASFLYPRNTQDWGEDGVGLLMQLVDVDGRALAKRMVMAVVLQDLEHDWGRPAQELELESDDEGYLLFALDNGSLMRDGRPILRQKIRLQIAAEEQTRRRAATLDLLREFESGVHDLGPVVLEEEQLLASGTVLDSDHRPLAEAWVRLLVKTEVQTDRYSVSVRNRTVAKTRTDQEGGYRLYGHPPLEGKKPRLTAKRTGHTEEEAPWTQMAQVHDFILTPKFVVQGRIALPANLSGKGFGVRFVQGVAGEASPFQASTNWVKEDNSFTIEVKEADPGYLLVTETSGWPSRVLGQVDGIYPWPAKERGDARLQPLDLTRLQVHEVEVVDAQGEVLDQVRFQYVKRDGGTTTRSGGGKRFGKCTFLSTEGRYDVAIQVAGYRSLETTLTEAFTRLEMQPRIPVTFTISRLPELRPGESPVLSLSAVEGITPVGLVDPSTFDAQGRLRTGLSHPGSYEVLVGIGREDNWSAKPLEDSDGNPVIVFIQETEEMQDFHLEVPDDFFETF